MHKSIFLDFGASYLDRLTQSFNDDVWRGVGLLYEELLQCWKDKNTVYFIGNGGSAGNAIHIANDFVYGIAKQHGKGMDAVSLSANASVLTCLANDLSYESIFSEQLAVSANEGDLLVALSGSGNSKNIVKALHQAKIQNLRSHLIVAFDGGEAKKIADNPIHLPINDMQIAEDSQLIIFHIVMQKLYEIRNSVNE